MDKQGQQDYRDFLLKVLQAIHDSNSDPRVVYPLLQANLDKLDKRLPTVLRSWATATLCKAEAQKAKYMAALIGHFSNLVQQFSLGDQASNVEITIAGYEVFATVFTRETLPQQWASVKSNLGVAHYHRIYGNKAENFEAAIRYYSAALEVYNQSSFHFDWAETLYNLGIAYCNRIRGKKAENLEISIRCYLDAIEVRTRQAFPKEWASTCLNLGTAYVYRINGNRAENLEAAIRYYLDALKVHTREAFPFNWAMLYNNLGEAYRERLQGERAENLETAIRYYIDALKVRTHATFPQEWAETQNNLGIVYFYRIREEQAENLESAIYYYSNALEVYTQKDFSEKWAATQNNLGNSYSNRIKGDKTENLEAAISCYLNALQVYTRKDFPEKWATTQNNLGSAYCRRIRGKTIENLEVALRCFNAALEITTYGTFPKEWAETQNNLGLAYLYRIWRKQAYNLKVAICCFKAALKVRTREAFPEDHIATQYNLGLAYQKAQQFRNTYNAFAAAINTVESLRGEIISGSGIEGDKQKLAEEWNDLYQRMVEVCLELGYYDQAIEYAERSKTRNLVELIITRDLHSIFPSEIVSQLEHLRVEIANGQYQLQTATAENPTALAQHLQQLRQQRNELQDRYLPIGYGFKVDKFKETLDDYTAIIQWYITSAGFETFIITRYSLQRLTLPAPPNDLKVLVDWANEYLDAYTQAKTQWINSLASRLSRLAEILHLEEILKLVPDTCSRLILIPHRYLHLFPLHALPLANGSLLLDRFPNGVGYAASCQLLQLTQKRERPDFSNLFAVLEPTRPDLPPLFYTNLEVEIIRHHFELAQIIEKEKATKTALQQSTEYLRSTHCLHFSCHGSFNLAVPLKSGLALADKNFTLAEIFGLDLSQCRLVTLSACETGLTDPTSISDEYIGLPSGFLYAGSPSVVSSLWPVNDLSTAFLMLKFYENFQSSQKQAGDVAVALNEAHKWLRNLTIEELDRFLNQHKPQLDRVLAQLRPGQRLIFQESLKQIRQRQPLPFANPYYWAAFTATGF